MSDFAITVMILDVIWMLLMIGFVVEVRRWKRRQP